MNNNKFHEWWKDRAIPKTRHGAKTALQKLGYSSTGSALVNNLALSLSDCYWICPRDERVSWADVNLFKNDFVDTFGEITINCDHVVDLRRETRFNCATSQGELQKKWCIAEDGRRYLIKGNYGDSYQQSLNEVFASTLHKQQGFERYTPYTLVRVTVDGGFEGLGCMSYDFCSEEIECISAWELLQTVKLRQNESFYYPLKEVCLGLGMPEQEFTDFIDYQIMTDYLLTNTDRHMNNIAVMRHPDTLELLGFAPIYDSGNSMFYNVPYSGLVKVRFSEIKTHSFTAKEAKLLQYVANRNLVDIEKASIDFSIYEQDVPERHMRIPKLKELYERKIEMLSVFQSGVDIWRNYRHR
ncbi:MAG: HipA domain-containing protein [Clostridia bacterium]|nr:HipA domain-containing protein [Clostridia bacterium]